MDGCCIIGEKGIEKMIEWDILCRDGGRDNMGKEGALRVIASVHVSLRKGAAFDDITTLTKDMSSLLVVF